MIKTSKERALLLPAGLELNHYIFQNILEVGEPEDGNRMPDFSKSPGSAQVLLTLILVGSGVSVTIDCAPDFFHEGEKKGQLFDIKRRMSIWRIKTSDGDIGYGRSFSEAICKLAIVRKNSGKI